MRRLAPLQRPPWRTAGCSQTLKRILQGAALQVREQAKAFLQKPEDHMQGLNLINSTNLDYFQPQHQAEMINLKAQFFAALGDSEAGACWGKRSVAGLHPAGGLAAVLSQR